MNWRRYLAELLDETGEDMNAVRRFNDEVLALDWPHPFFHETVVIFTPQHEPEVLGR